MINNYKFNLIDRFVGYNSTRDKTNLDPRFLIRGSKNVYIKQSGTLANRPGLKRRGSVDSTSAGVKSSTTWEASNGVTKPLRVCDGKLQVESDIVTSGTYVWYDLMTPLTLTRFVFDTVWDNTLKKDFLVFVKGDSNLHRWDGGIAVIASTTVNTIVLTETVASSGFNTTSGSVLINGTTYTYTGSSASTLTGVTADPTGEANGSVVLSAIVTTATTPASGFENDFLKVINNQVWVGSYSSRLIYISEDDDYLDYTVPSPRAPGDPELLFLDNLGRGIGSNLGEGYISAGTSDWYRVRFQQITVSTTLTEQTIVDKLELSGQEAALGHEYITSAYGSLVYLARDQQLKMLGQFTNSSQVKPVTISLQIKDELSNQTFTPVQGETSDGEVKTVGGKIYVTSATGGLTYIHETREALDESGQVVSERFWNPPQVWGISRVEVINGVEYGHAIANPQIYQLWDTEQWFDDSPSEENLPYDCVAFFAYRNAGKDRNALLDLNMMFYEGYMPQGVNLKSVLYFNYQGSSGTNEKDINSSSSLATFFTGFMSPGLGDSSLGDNPLGEGLTEEELSQEQLSKFRKINGVGKVNCHEYAPKVYSDEVNARWELLTLGGNEVINTKVPTNLRD